MENNIEEIWMEIAETNGAYSVSNQGVVRSNLRKSKKILKDWAHPAGYRRVSLGRKKMKYVHRLVATCFCPNPHGLPAVDHIDGNRENNHATNLRWVTTKQNIDYGAERHNWESQRAASAKRRIHHVQKEEYEKLVLEGCSLRQIARLLGTSHSSVSKTLKCY
jgi:hypothetical protein